jgi:hypothetical protein
MGRPNTVKSSNKKGSPPPSPKKKSSPPSSPKKWKWSPGAQVLVSTGGDSKYKTREQYFDLVKTQVNGLYIGFCTKAWATNEASYLFPMEKGLNDNEMGESLAKKWKYVFGFLPRRDTAIDDGTTTMKTKKGSKWDWKVIIVLIDEEENTVDEAGHHIAKWFSKFTKNKDMMDTPEKYTYRQCFSNEPQPLNHYLLDLDIVKLVKSLNWYDSKEEMIEDKEGLATLYGTPETGKKYVEEVSEEDWEDLLDDTDN